jgi:CheY-like chemotaxis protein
MNEQAAKLFVGEVGVCAVLVDVLIDKGLISQGEFFDRFQRAHAAAGRRLDGVEPAPTALADMLAYLEPEKGERSAAALARSVLGGEIVLLVEQDPDAARALRAALEDAGAEVLAVRSAAEALARIAQFDFSAAVIEWRPERREHRALMRWLREDGVPFLLCAAQAGPDAAAPGAEPMLRKPVPPQDIVKALARLAGSADQATAQSR